MAMDPYSILGVPRDADQAAIKMAYRRKAQALHPDRNPDNPHAPTQFQQVQESYDILGDPDRRARYDSGEDVRVGVDQEARDLVIHALHAGLSTHGPDGIVGWMRRYIKDQRRGVYERIEQAERANDNLEAAKGRYRHDGGGVDVLTFAIDCSISSNLDGVAKLKRQIKVFGVATEMMSGYEDQEAPELVFINAMSSATGTNR